MGPEFFLAYVLDLMIRFFERKHEMEYKVFMLVNAKIAKEKAEQARASNKVTKEYNAMIKGINAAIDSGAKRTIVSIDHQENINALESQNYKVAEMVFDCQQEQHSGLYQVIWDESENV